MSKVCFSNRPKKIPKSVGARTHPCLSPLRILNGFEDLAAIELHCSLRVSVERVNHALQFGWATDHWENVKEAVSADKIKRLSEINESDVQRHVLCTSLVTVEGRRPCLLLTVQLGSHIVTTLRQLLEAYQYDPSKYFADNAEYGDASVVVKVVPLALVLV